MRKLIFLTIAIGTLGCQKCYDCRAVDTVTNEVWDAEYVCGESEKDDYENTFNDSSIDSRAECTPDD